MRALAAAVLVLMSAAPSSAQTAIDWSTNATELRGRNGQQFIFRCPAGGSPATVWGTDLYSDDSSICTAAVHAVPGLNARAGFDVTIQVRPGATGYRGSIRNGITTGEWGEWVGSFVVVSANGTAATTGLSKAPEPIDWSTSAVALRNQAGAQVAVTCPAGGSAGAVWGTDIYSDDSSICTAAVHAGRMTFASGGTVTIQITGARTGFQPSTRNGVTSGSWGEWPGSFVFVGRN